MEHMFFEVQLCIKISIFNEKSNFCYSDHPGLGTGLHNGWACSAKTTCPAEPCELEARRDWR